MTVPPGKSSESKSNPNSGAGVDDEGTEEADVVRE